MRRTEIIHALKERGYKAQEHEIIKSGLVYNVISIDNEGVGVIVYTDSLLRMAELRRKNLDEITNECIHICKKNQKNAFCLFPMKKEFILAHVYIGLQKESEENIEKRECYLEGLEEYLYIRWIQFNEIHFMKLPSSYFADKREEAVEAWEKAKINTNSETCIFNINQMINELKIIPMFVITNIVKSYGASAILNHSALAEFAKKLEVNSLIVMPSSVHEMIIVPNDGKVTVNDASTMVKEINATKVSPEERLTDRAYVLEF